MLKSAPTLAIATGLTLLLAGGAYLYAVRGPALLMDMAVMARGMLCL